MDTDSSLKADSDVYLANGFKYGTLSQRLHKRSMDKGLKKKKTSLHEPAESSEIL